MGTKGASGLREWMIGSNTEKMVRTSPVPVIAIKHFRPGQHIRHIVFPNSLDTENQEDLIMKVKALQDFFQAKLHIIWINTPAVFRPDDDARRKLKAFAERFMLTNYTINVFNYSDEESGIVEFANQVKGDLIAMGTHGLTGIAHYISGSLAEDVVNHVQYPVWTYCSKYSRVSVEN
jgi:nucleotide-binding universal stress UspA family protein